MSALQNLVNQLSRGLAALFVPPLQGGDDQQRGGAGDYVLAFDPLPIGALPIAQPVAARRDRP